MNDNYISRPRARRPAPTPQNSAHEGDRIAKVMARAGLCSRRDAEEWIAQGRVAVNGHIVERAALNVTDADRITVDGQPMARRERTRLFLFHKPRGLVTTDKDPDGRPTIFEALPETMPRVVTIGRLDINTEGLLLLTNDGGLARVLELPATGWLRRYRVRAFGDTDQAVLDRLNDGLTIDGIDYRGIEAKIDRSQGDNVWITMGLREGKNREIKRVLEHIGLQVNRLIRISYGPFQLGELGEGAVEEVRTRVLKDQLGPTLAAEAGADFDAVVATPDADRQDRGERGERSARPRGRLQRDEQPAPAAPAEPHSPLRKRKHVSTMREERSEGNGRKRITRSATEDRKGRAVTVERVAPVARADKSVAGSRNGRRFAAAANGDRPMRKGAPAGGGKAPFKRAARPEGEASTFAARSSRPPRRDGDSASRSEGRPFRDRPAGDKPRFARDGARPERPVRDGESRPRFQRDGDAPRGEGRPFRDKPAGDKPRFARDGARPERPARDGEARPRFQRDGGAPRGEGRPFRDKPAGDKPRFARDGARPERPARDGEARPRFKRDGDAPRGEGRPFRDKPAGDKPRFARDGARPERPARDGEGRGFRGGPRSESAGSRSDSPRKPGGGKPSFGKSAAGKSFSGKPAGKSFSGKPGGRSPGKPGGRPPRGAR